jgi:hypothetical protein
MPRPKGSKNKPRTTATAKATVGNINIRIDTDHEEKKRKPRTRTKIIKEMVPTPVYPKPNYTSSQLSGHAMNSNNHLGDNTPNYMSSSGGDPMSVVQHIEGPTYQGPTYNNNPVNTSNPVNTNNPVNTFEPVINGSNENQGQEKEKKTEEVAKTEEQVKPNTESSALTADKMEDMLDSDAWRDFAMNTGANTAGTIAGVAGLGGVSYAYKNRGKVKGKISGAFKSLNKTFNNKFRGGYSQLERTASSASNASSSGFTGNSTGGSLANMRRALSERIKRGESRRGDTSPSNYATSNVNSETFNNQNVSQRLNFNTPRIRGARASDIDSASIFTPVRERLRQRNTPSTDNNIIDQSIEQFSAGILSPSTNTGYTKEEAATALQANFRMKLAKNKAKVMRANETPGEKKQRTSKINLYGSFLNQSAATRTPTPNTRAFTEIAPLTQARSRLNLGEMIKESRRKEKAAATTLQAAMRREIKKDTFVKKSHAAYERGRENRLTAEAKNNPIKTDKDFIGESKSYIRGYTKDKKKPGPKPKDEDKDNKK